MKILISAIMFLILTTTINGIGLVEKVCKATPNYERCMKVLSADPRAPHADITTLAVIMIDADKAKSEETVGLIKDLQKTRPDLKVPLEQCDFIYEVAILKVLIPDTYETVREDPKVVESSMGRVAMQAQRCENYFPKGKSPLTALNALVQDLSGVASAILHLL